MWSRTHPRDVRGFPQRRMGKRGGEDRRRKERKQQRDGENEKKQTNKQRGKEKRAMQLSELSAADEAEPS